MKIGAKEETVIAQFTYDSNGKIRKAILSSAAVYDMTKGGTQTFHIPSASGSDTLITVSEPAADPAFTDKTYSVSFSSPLAWDAGYKIDVQKGAIASAHSPWHETKFGSITSARLTLESEKQVTYYMTWKTLVDVVYTGVRTTVSADKIKIYNI